MDWQLCAMMQESGKKVHLRDSILEKKEMNKTNKRGKGHSQNSRLGLMLFFSRLNSGHFKTGFSSTKLQLLREPF